MTFLLQKFNAINRTCTEVRARNGLRPTAGGIAFTGRLAACLLLAGFLGVGSAIAQGDPQQQPVILRVGGGGATLSLAEEGLDGGGGIHHYVLGGTTAGVVPGDLANFVVSTIAHVVVTGGNMTITPITAGAFKLAFDTDPDDANEFDTPFNVEVMSSGAPYITGVTGAAGVYNEGVTAPHVHSRVALTLKDETSMSIRDIDGLFNDPNDITITHSVEADPVKKVDPRDDAKMIDVAVVSATISSDMTLTIALTGDAEALDDTKVWLKATDAAGEYARLQINVVEVTAAQDYYANDAAQGNKVYRDDDVASGIHPAPIDLTTGFTMGARPGTVHYSVDFTATGGTAVPNKNGASYTVVTPALVMAIAQTGSDPGAPGNGASFQITDFRSTGEVDLTVRATNAYTCPAGYATESGPTPTNIMADDCAKVLTRDADGDPATLSDTDKKDSMPDQSKGASYSFTISVISKTTPKPTANAIAKVTLVADGDPMMVDLADVDSETAGAQPAFSVPAAAGEMMYTVTLSEEIATVSVEGSVITFAPIWHGDKAPKTATATVTAENALGETYDRTIAVEVTHAVSPVVNQHVAGALALGYTVMLKTGDRAMTLNLQNLMIPNPMDPTMTLEVGPIFTNPYPDHGSLPGGLLYEMEVEADFKSPESTKNNVITIGDDHRA